MSFNVIANPISPLRHAYPRAAGRIAYVGGGQSTPTNTTVTQSNLPKELMPYATRTLGRAEALSLEPFQTYGGQRLADSSDFADIGAAQGMVRGVAGRGISGLSDAQGAARDNINRAQQLGQYDTGEFSEFGFDPTRQFTGQEVQQYMSPYIENVLDVQKSRAMDDFDRLRGSRNAQAVQAGAFGGSRQGVQEGMAQEALLRNMADIDATGYQSAFDRAGDLFGRDRTAQFEAQRAQADERGRVQTGTEASRQFGAGQGIAALGAGTTAANQLVGFGQEERAADIQNAQLLDAIGQSERAEAQAGMDIGYQDFLEQRAYPQEQLAFMSDITRGSPLTGVGTNTQTGSVYTNPVQQALGAGLSGLSLYKAYS